jgi:sugar/nucleoside kinase (ribokinase family)
MRELDYLCIGHVTRDLTAAGPAMGGTATYSARTVRALGKQVAVVTSAGPGYDLREALLDIPVSALRSAATTTFENIYAPDGRRQIIHSVADRLGAAAVPQEWLTPILVHLGPVAAEIDEQLIHHFDGALIGLTPQGWHRKWSDDGRVASVRWPAAAQVLPLATAVVVSQEDIDHDDTWALYHQTCQLLVITNGAAGCVVHYEGRRRHFSALSVVDVDATGVGDIFAAAFFVRLWETGGDPWEAARFATRIASPTVARPGLDGIPTRAEIAAARLSAAGDANGNIEGQGSLVTS